MLSIAIAFAAASVSAAPADLSAWVAQVNRQIDKHVVRPTADDAGMAVVSFRRGDDGRPVDITAKSGSPALTRAAVRTVKAIGVLPAMPPSMNGVHRVTFKFLVGRTGFEDDYMIAHTAMMTAANSSNTALAARLASEPQAAAVPGDASQLASLKRP